MPMKLSMPTLLTALAPLMAGAQAQTAPAPAESPQAPAAARPTPVVPDTPATPATQAKPLTQGTVPSPAQGATPTASPVRQAFQRTDVNGDGRLTREEAAALPAVAENFNRLDKDGDGFISAAEFEAGVAVGGPAPQ